MKQHLVSRVLLRRFADHHNGPVSAFDLDSKEEMTNKVERLGQIQDFTVVGAETAEETWQTVEKRLPYAFELIESRRILRDSAALDTIRDCIALHWARSFITNAMFDYEYQNSTHQFAMDVINKAGAPQVAKALTGFYIPGLSAAPIAYQKLWDHFKMETDSGGVKVNVFRNLFEKGREKAKDSALEFVVVCEGEFLLADAPVIAWGKETESVGPLQGVKWGQHDLFFMVLGPRHVVALASRFGYREIDETFVNALNFLQTKGAFKYVYYRPSSGLGDYVRSVLERNESQ